MTARTRLVTFIGVILFATSGLISGAALPSAVALPAAATHNPPGVSYVALGDSYAAGVGGGAYTNACQQSPYGYPTLLTGLKGINLVANPSCAGATTTDVVTTQASAIVRGTGLVTLTVGANDLNVIGVANACTVSATSPACQAAIAGASAVLAPGATGGPSVLASRLAAAIAVIVHAAPGARVVVTGYPILFAVPAPTNPNYGIITTINSATGALDTTISGVVASARAAGANVSYVDVTGLFAGHGIGSAWPWIVNTGSAAFHPNQTGYRAYAGVLAYTLLNSH